MDHGPRHVRQSKGSGPSGKSVDCSIISNTTRGTWCVVQWTLVPARSRHHASARLHLGHVEKAVAVEEVLAGEGIPRSTFGCPSGGHAPPD
jgi:hypothetical protein